MFGNGKLFCFFSFCLLCFHTSFRTRLFRLSQNQLFYSCQAHLVLWLSLSGPNEVSWRLELEIQFSLLFFTSFIILCCQFIIDFYCIYYHFFYFSPLPAFSQHLFCFLQLFPSVVLTLHTAAVLLQVQLYSFFFQPSLFLPMTFIDLYSSR